MSSIEDRLLSDIAWREDELVILKTDCAQSSETTPRGRSLRRAYVALLYAHYEGFAKVAWEEYLIEVSRCGLSFGRLKPGLIASFLKSEMGIVRNCPDALFADGVLNFRMRLLDRVAPPYDAIETSNLWPHVFEEVMTHLGLEHAFLAAHTLTLKSLVGRRNDIAHGEKVGVTDVTIAALDLAVWEVFFNLTVVVTDACGARAYRA